MKDLFLPQITGTTDVLKFLVYVTKEIGVGFHPDTLFSDYIESNGNPVYTATEARLLQDKLVDCIDYYEAVYTTPDFYAVVIKASKFGAFQASHKVVTDNGKIIAFLHSNERSIPASLPFALHVYTGDYCIDEPKKGEYSLQIGSWSESGPLEEMEYALYDWTDL